MILLLVFHTENDQTYHVYSNLFSRQIILMNLIIALTVDPFIPCLCSQVIFKSCKLIPVMIGGMVIQGELDRTYIV